MKLKIDYQKSGILHEAQTMMQFYQNVFSQLTQVQPLSVNRKMRTPTSSGSLHTSIKGANCLFWISQYTIQKLAQKEYDMKKQQQDKKAVALVNAEPGSTKEKILQRVKHVEHTKAIFLRLLSIKLKPSGGVSLVKVQTGLPNNPRVVKEWRTITDPSARGQATHHGWTKDPLGPSNTHFVLEQDG